jgi:alpha-L-arabinofuranosidase
VGTWNTSAEFRDIQVASGGRVLYQSDFARSASGWAPAQGRGRSGSWSVVDGAYRQTDRAVSFSYYGEDDWRDVTVTLKARKISGAEGFLVVVGSTDGRQVRWNVGGWNNRRHAIQAGDTVIGEYVDGSVEEGRWYDVRLEVRDRTVRGFLDGQLIQERTLPRIDRVLAIAGRDERANEIVLKVVNSASEPARMNLSIAGAAVGADAHVTVLSGAPTDENTFEDPAKIAPRTSAVRLSGSSFTHEFPAYSLTIISFRAQ